MPQSSKSIAEILACGVAVRAHEAVAVVQGICARLPQARDGSVAVLADLSSAFLDAHGEISVENLVEVPSDEALAYMSRLLAQMLLADLQAEFQYPDDSRAAIADVLENAANGVYHSVAEFSCALGRFEKHWRVEFLRELFHRTATRSRSGAAGSGAAPNRSQQPRADRLASKDAPAGENLQATEPVVETRVAADSPIDPAIPSLVPDVVSHYRQAREAAGISLAQIAGRSKIPMTVLEALEAGAWGEIPRGIFGRSYIRTYASEIGLDPEEVLAAVQPHLPRDESLDSIRAVVLEARGERPAPDPRLRTNADADDDRRRSGLLGPRALMLSAAALILTLAALFVLGNIAARAAAESQAIYGGAGLPPPAADVVPVATSGVSLPRDIWLPPPAPTHRPKP